MVNLEREESEERFRGIIENALDIITLIDEEGTVVYNSPAFARLLGYESWEVLGQKFFNFIHEDDRAYMERAFGKLTMGNVSSGFSLEFRFQHKDGRWRVFESMVSNLLKNEMVQAVVLNSRDVTAHKESEAELEKYRSHLEELVERRTRELTTALETEKTIVEQQKIFVSTVSHEFRTPLAIIDGNAQIIQKRGQTLSPEALQKRASTIRAAADRVVRLIEAILSAHTLESGKMTLTFVPCDIAEVIRNVCNERLDMAPTHKITVNIDEGLPKMVADEKLIHQIMVNLVSNAVKYSPRTPLVEVRAFREMGMLVIKVTDHGVGIPEDELPRIFTRYFRASTSGGIPGSGMGLSLVKLFVEMHGGNVTLQSKVGIGTTITVHIPIKEVKQQESEDGKNTAD